jgi:hypothetical protein
VECDNVIVNAMSRSKWVMSVAGHRPHPKSLSAASTTFYHRKSHECLGMATFPSLISVAYTVPGNIILLVQSVLLEP